jgi:hypothetical protein
MAPSRHRNRLITADLVDTVQDHHVAKSDAERYDPCFQGAATDPDPDLGAALRALRARVRTVDGARARALESGIERVLDTFYPG